VKYPVNTAVRLCLPLWSYDHIW